MNTINNQEFGLFLQSLRKEKGLTQKQLAEKLLLSDKAISKWERGLSFPDISLLIPLSEIFNVTTTELLCGKRIDASLHFSVEEVDTVVSKTISLSNEDKISLNFEKKKRVKLFAIAIMLFVIEIIYLFVVKNVQLPESIYVVELLMLIFGTYFTFFVQDRLPIYYDEHSINQYSHGGFRLNIPGVNFNNSNWKYIVKTAQISILSILLLSPVIYVIIFNINHLLWLKFELTFTLITIFSMFVPMYIVGKKYE